MITAGGSGVGHPAPIMVNGPRATTGEPFTLRNLVLTGVMLALLLLAGLGGWAVTADLAGAVIAPGAVVVDQNLKAVQHRDGGIVGEIAVREGEAVQAGQLLIRLDDAQTRAELSIVTSQIHELAARRARLLAERDGREAITFPAGLDAADPVAVTGEMRLFEGNRALREGQKRQLRLQVSQIRKEIVGLEAQLASKAEEVALVEQEYAKSRDVVARGLDVAARVYAAERERARLRGEHAAIQADIARAHTRISELESRILDLDEGARNEAQRELAEVETRHSELQDRRMAIEDRLSRTDLRAPITGTINELNVHTIGGVITPAEVLATIVPAQARLKVAVQLPPAHIEQVTTAQHARLRFTSFNQRTTPELEGRVLQVAPATTRDPETGERYYRAELGLMPGEEQKLGGKLVPGMPVEVFITTEERSALSYLLRPLTDQFARAFRER
ncbi:MAG: HlyD family type I secretion periplasmic adaptor subunit [Thiohalomonadaceae bacterium]